MFKIYLLPHNEFLHQLWTKYLIKAQFEVKLPETEQLYRKIL